MADFPKGFYFKEPHANAPDFVQGKMSVKVQDAIQYLQGIKTEYLNLDCKISKDGKGYCQVDEWKPDPNRQQSSGPQNQEQYYSNQGGSGQSGGFDDGIPFAALDGRVY